MQEESVFRSRLFEQRKTIRSLIDESRADGDFYLFLSFAAFITTLGLHINNAVVVVGAMLIAPILFPILSLGMAIVTSNKASIKRAFWIIVKSILVVVGVSFVTSFLINQREVTEQIINASIPNLLFFFIAIFSGVIASYAWAKQNTSASLSGVAITVSLVPPLAAIGISISLFSRQVFTGSVMLFVINLIGIVLASIVVFSLFGFARLRSYEEKKIEEEEKKEHQIIQENTIHGGES